MICPRDFTTGLTTVRGALYGPYWVGRIEYTQLNIFDAIPVAMFLVHTFEKLKAINTIGNTVRFGQYGSYWSIVSMTLRRYIWNQFLKLKGILHEHHNGS